MSTNTELDALKNHLRALEESLLQPDVRKSEQLVELLADDFIEFGTSGRIYTKEDLVAVLQAESPSTQTTGNVKVALLAPTVALLTYFIRHEATPPGYTLRSSVWQMRGEESILLALSTERLTLGRISGHTTRDGVELRSFGFTRETALS